MVDHTFTEKFKYKHDNPYHDRLESFDDFVLRDHEGEEFQGQWNDNIFKRQAPIYIEIGTGYGHFMIDFCEKNPDVSFVGMDYRFKRSFTLAKRLAKHPSKNFRYLRARGERIQFLFGENEVDRIFYFFPDPWPKKRHHKKRLFQEIFLENAYKVLKPDGQIFIKTDHDEYAKHMAEVIEQTDLFTCELKSFDLRKEHPDHFLCSFETKFEKIFLEKGNQIKGFTLRTKKTKGL